MPPRKLVEYLLANFTLALGLFYYQCGDILLIALIITANLKAPTTTTPPTTPPPPPPME